MKKDLRTYVDSIAPDQSEILCNLTSELQTADKSIGLYFTDYPIVLLSDQTKQMHMLV